MAFWKNRRRRSLAAAAGQGSIVALALVALGGIVVLKSCTPLQHSTADFSTTTVDPSVHVFSGRVTQTVDGDTFRINSRSVSIRVWGLDAPETDEAGGAAATAALAKLISRQDLRCRQRDIDRYGRIVGQCVLPNGHDITAAMIASGTAREYCRFSGNFYGTC